MTGAEQKHRRGDFAELLVKRHLGDRRRPASLFATVIRRECPRDPALVVELAMGGEGPRLLGRFEPAHRGKIVTVKGLSQRLDHAAAALAEIWTERPIAEFRVAAASRERVTRRGDRRVFELAAADGAEKAAVRLEHDTGAAFARHRAGSADDADERGTAVPLNRFSDAGPNFRHCCPRYLIPPCSRVEGSVKQISARLAARTRRRHRPGPPP